MCLLEIFWTLVLIASVAAFFGIAAIVSFKSIGDIKELFHHLSQDNN